VHTCSRLGQRSPAHHDLYLKRSPRRQAFRR
jgi:hypothetical protein